MSFMPHHHYHHDNSLDESGGMSSEPVVYEGGASLEETKSAPESETSVRSTTPLAPSSSTTAAAAAAAAAVPGPIPQQEELPSLIFPPKQNAEESQWSEKVTPAVESSGGRSPEDPEKSEGLKSSTSKPAKGGRKVQWSIAEEPAEPARHAPSRLGRNDGADYFSQSHVSSDGTTTPEQWSAANSSTFNTPDASRPSSPGEPNVGIAAGETDGLPHGHSLRRFQQQAAKLIAVHRAKNAFMQAQSQRSHHRRDASGQSDVSHHNQGEGVDADELRQALRKTSLEEGQRPSNGLIDDAHPYAATTGVLSSLLQLYNEENKQQQQQQQQNTAQSSQATLVNNPPQEAQAAADPSRAPSPTSLSLALRRAAASAGGAVRRPISSLRDDRVTRSSGGVVGALQGSSLGLAGVATPAGSAVRPDHERSGYRLSRFSLPDTDRKTASAPGSRSNSPTRLSADQSRDTSQPSSPPFTPSKPAAGASTADSLQLPPPAALSAHSSPGTPNPAQEVYGRHRKPHLNLSFSNLADTFNPTKLRSESHVLRHYKSSSNLPAEELKPTYEKVVHDKEQRKRESKSQSHSAPSTPKGGAAVANTLGLRKKPKKPKPNQQELFITMHVAQILARQDFILRLARSLMMFGGPSHQFETQLQRTAKVLDIDCSVIYLMSFMIVAFQDPDTHTSELKIIKQNGGLNIHKLKCLAILHWEVMHDKISVTDASTEISRLMTAKPTWNRAWSICLGGLCSACVGISAFKVSFVDMLVAMTLGCTLVTIQTFVAAKSEVLSNCFELFTAALFSFIAAGLSSTGYFCYASVISSSIVLLLPGWLILPAAMELQSRSIVVGSVRLVWALIYSLFLGFGISLGSVIWNAIAPGRLNIPNDSSCRLAHSVEGADSTPWWLVTLPPWFFFVGVPGFAMALAMKNQAKFRSKEFWASTLLASMGWTINYFASQAEAFRARSDISSALAALSVGIIANLYGKYFQSTSFVVAVTPIMLMLPSGLSNSGFLNYAVAENDTNSTLSSGFDVATQLLSVTIGLVVGLFGASIFVYPFSSKRAKGLMSF